MQKQLEAGTRKRRKIAEANERLAEEKRRPQIVKKIKRRIYFRVEPSTVPEPDTSDASIPIPTAKGVEGLGNVQPTPVVNDYRLSFSRLPDNQSTDSSEVPALTEEEKLKGRRF